MRLGLTTIYQEYNFAFVLQSTKYKLIFKNVRQWLKINKLQVIQIMQVSWKIITKTYAFMYMFCFAWNSFSLCSVYRGGLLF